MRAIIDSNVFLYMLAEPARLSAQQLSVVRDPASELLLSLASVWEIVIKSGLGKLTLPVPPEELFTVHLAQFSVQLLPIMLPHILRVHALPLHHRDPFDRLIVAQGLTERLPILTSDSKLTPYGAPIIQ